MQTIIILLLLFPLAGALCQVACGRILPRRMAEGAACAAMLASFAMAAVAFFRLDRQITFTLVNWIRVANFSAPMDIRYDALAAVMTLMVTFVSSLIMLYSVSYMRHDRDYSRYFCYLSLFVFFMLIIVLADNLVFLFLGWEGVGFCSYALIGFWYEDRANATAGRKAFLLTRIGDIGFTIAIALFFINVNSLSITEINARAASLPAGTAMLLGLLLCWASTGKSAQLPLLVWLPDAMAGPTPVSALIHAATMVTAGVYLLIRLFPVISLTPVVLETIAVVGTVTALYAACAALAQRDIKRVLAYSTISQVGYMFLAIGAGDIVSSVFHLLTHAFFKSLLFLSAGCVIHALDDERNIFRMGAALRQRHFAVFLLFLAGSLALGGVPPSAGFFSKGAILVATLGRGTVLYEILWAAATLTAFLTTLYIFRLVFIAFSGKPVIPGEIRIQPVPAMMVWPLWPLALLALGAGFLNMPQLQEHGGWLTGQLARLPGAMAGHAAPSSTVEWTVEGIDSLLAPLGLLLAYFLYGPKNTLGWRIEEPFGHKLTGLLFSGFGLDRLYEAVVLRPYEKAAVFLWKNVDEAFLDQGLIIRPAGFFPFLARGLRHWTTGLLSTSLKMLLLGFAAILVFLVF